MKIDRVIIFLAALLILSGCTTLEPYDPISDAEFKGPFLRVVRSAPVSYLDMEVRWGGDIARVENRVDETWVEIVERPLYKTGRPHDSDTSGGRFIVRIVGFLDPAIYAEGRQITIVGTLEPSIRRNIGEHLYDFPVVNVKNYRLWEKPRQAEVIYYYPELFWNSYRIHRSYPWYYPYPSL